MSHNTQDTRRTQAHSDDLTVALDLLTMLSAAPHHTLDRTEIARVLQLDQDQIGQALKIIGSLADRMSGARAAVRDEDGTVELIGDAARMKPMRLTLPEGMVLSHLLDVLQIDEAVKARILRSLLPLDASPSTAHLSQGSEPGKYYSVLTEAIQDGVRCSMLYRKRGETAPSWRSIDPGYIEFEAGTAYLIAWDIDANAERRYRIDRIAELSYTEDSVISHDWSHTSTAESLHQSGQVAHIRFSSAELLASRTWAGMGKTTAELQDDHPTGALTAELAYTSEPWLFDQILAAGGEIQLIAPLDLTERFISYARALIDSAKELA
ncbi:WYL domain-containing protein [Collinsella sp. AGMB00827]|uniref:WYL domain-containing protein n=1 Tax=Collinsella ureilytica TaxID=2869515 RepID=A0ABS7MKC3_9ACTN|nr:WYL domain-containing protein [Collinsella urealyticum]MBY4797814.1 WYL domain-containing protein [Collinsella urealyticum]